MSNFVLVPHPQSGSWIQQPPRHALLNHDELCQVSGNIEPIRQPNQVDKESDVLRRNRHGPVDTHGKAQTVQNIWQQCSFD